jgi:y4mF family transcriptional regulator
MITIKDLALLIKKTRKKHKFSQKDLALTAGTGLRFISELENGKKTCQIGKVLTVLHTLGLKLSINSNYDADE